MATSRRAFLKTTAGCGCGALLSQFLQPSLVFAEGSCSGGSGAHIIHLVLDGAHDGPFMFPFLDQGRYDALATRRSPLMLPRDQGVSFGHSVFGVHPFFDVRPVTGSMSVRDMLQAGEARLISCVGMPLDKRSHPESINALMAGLPSASAASSTQWTARLMDTCGFTPYQVFRMGTAPGLSLERASGGPPPIDISTSLRNFGWDDDGDPELRRATSVLQQILSLQEGSAPPHKKALVSTMASVFDAIPKVKEVANVPVAGRYSGYAAGGGSVWYDGEGQLFADAARIVRYNEARGLKSIVQIGLWGFDHHSNMPSELGERMARINQNLSQLRADLAPHEWRKTIVIVSSEFGRSLFGASGTEHGYGNVTLVLGGGLRSGSDQVLGALPSVGDLLLPDPDARAGKFTPLPMHVDYRQIYSEALAWLGVDPAAIFPGYMSSPGSSLGLFGTSII